MSSQALNLRKSAAILWRHKVAVGVLIALGAGANVAHSATLPQVFTSSALVVVGPSVNTSGQTVVVDSIPVLTGAIRAGHLGVPLQALRTRVKAVTAATQTIAVQAEGNTAGQAESIANAVAHSYVAYSASPSSPVGQEPVTFLQSATTATAKPRTTSLYEAAGIGGLAAALVALIGSLAIWRNERRPRERDAIADSIGVPVLASLRVRRPRNVASWAEFLGGYQPEAAAAWRLELVLADLRLRHGPGAGASVAVLSLSADEQALALAPQLAVFAASRGVPTVLVLSPQQDSRAMAAAAAAAAAAGRARENLQVVANDDGASGHLPSGDLTVIVAVVDGRAPRVAETMRADATLLGVTAGAVTAEQLARVNASAAAAGRAIDGVLLGNPVPGDQTTGRAPQIARPEQARMPIRMSGVVMEKRR